jgi:anti-sigma regulatory factor (Ser/Thr protein kinase)
MSSRAPPDDQRTTRAVDWPSPREPGEPPHGAIVPDARTAPADGGAVASIASVRAGSATTQLLVEEASQVAQARREALALGRRVSLDAETADRLALVVTEAATNLVKHAKGGRMLLAPLALGATTGVEVITLDRGPGMQNIAASMRDGHSTAGSPGLGLGSISRLASNLDIYSQPGAGTVLRFEVWTETPTPRQASIAFGGVCVAMPGEEVPGDGWQVESANGRHRAVVVDGLGHGIPAATATRAALRVAHENGSAEPAALLTLMHGALRSTRGAAAALATLRPHASSGVFAGIGNIRALVRTAETTRSLVSHNGTLGHQVRKFQAFDFAFPPQALFVLHSDGIATHWSLDAYPGLERRHPGVIAAVVYRDHARARDDATIVVVRNDTRART